MNWDIRAFLNPKGSAQNPQPLYSYLTTLWHIVYIYIYISLYIYGCMWYSLSQISTWIEISLSFFCFSEAGGFLWILDCCNNIRLWHNITCSTASPKSVQISSTQYCILYPETAMSLLHWYVAHTGEPYVTSPQHGYHLVHYEFHQDLAEFIMIVIITYRTGTHCYKHEILCGICTRTSSTFHSWKIILLFWRLHVENLKHLAIF